MPLRQQLTSTECGAACLAMILAYYGRHERVSRLRDLGSGRDGMSARTLARAAEQYGLRTTVDRVDPISDPPSRPTIAYLAERHFVVLEKVSRLGVRIADPKVGRYWSTKDEFAERYGGALLRLDRAARFERVQNRWRDGVLVRYLREFVAARGGRRLLGAIIGLAAVMQLVGLAMPLATKLIVDTFIPQQRWDLLPMMGIAILGIALLQGGFTLSRQILLVVLRVRADRLLTRRFVGHLIRLPLTFFLQRARGDLLMRLGSVSTTRENLTQQALTVVLDTALLSGYAIGLAVFAPGYLIVVALLGSAQIFTVLSTYGRLRRLAQRELMAKSDEQNYLVESLDAVVSVKANGVESRAEARWRELFDTYQHAMRRRGMLSAKLGATQSGLGTLTPLALLWFGMWMVLRGDMTLGTMLAANALAGSVLGPVQNLVSSSQMFSVMRAQMDRIYDVLDGAPEPTGTCEPYSRAPSRIRVNDLTFRYHADAAPVLEGIEFDVRAGSKVAVVGRTGSGKSTLALLILGMLPVPPESIHHDGAPIEQWNLSALRRDFGAVLQDLTLFNGTIRDNLTLTRPNATDDEVRHAADVAGLHDDVMALPMGYQTIVGEGGAALSGGQRQRVALARAIVHKPRLLVLDEATSHLDAATERRVDDALSNLMVTRVVISHRLSAVRNADDILVLDRGRIAARGRHENLIAEGGEYAELFVEAWQGSAPRADGVDTRRREALNV